MNLFKNPITNTILVNKVIPKINKELKNQNRKEIEDIAEKIHPACGKAVRRVNNIADTITNAQDSAENGIKRTLFSSGRDDFNIGDHLFVQRIGYTHHGLYIGNRKVIHYLAECIREDSLEIFADGAKIQIKSESESPIKYPKDKVIERAYSRYGEDKYNLLVNNCENFVRWCRSGGEEY